VLSLNRHCCVSYCLSLIDHLFEQSFFYKLLKNSKTEIQLLNLIHWLVSNCDHLRGRHRSKKDELVLYFRRRRSNPGGSAAQQSHSASSPSIYIGSVRNHNTLTRFPFFMRLYRGIGLHVINWILIIKRKFKFHVLSNPGIHFFTGAKEPQVAGP